MPRPGVATPHLWIVATEPLATTSEAILVNVTTLRDHSDTTLILDVGDHPFIVRKSVIFFDDAQIIDTRKLAAGIQAGFWRQKERCSDYLIDRIQKALVASLRTPEKIKIFYRALKSESGIAGSPN